MFRHAAVLTVAAFGLGNAALAADALPPAYAPTAESGWIATVTGNVATSPKYPGSDEMGFMGYPSISFGRAGQARPFSTPDDGLSIGAALTPQIRAGLVGKFQGGRYDGDNRELTGIRDVDWAIEPGLFGEFWPVQDRIRTRIEIRRGFGGHEGFVGSIGADLVDRFGAWTVSAGPRVQLADSEYMNTYFGVTAADAAANGRVAQYKADGGLRSYGVAASATYRFNPSWATTVYAGYDRLADEAAKSPIVRSFGSPDQFRFGASMSYSFAVPNF